MHDGEHILGGDLSKSAIHMAHGQEVKNRIRLSKSVLLYARILITPVGFTDIEFTRLGT